MDYISHAHQGVKGQILDGLTNNPIKNASLKVYGRDMVFLSTNKGEFWRLLLPGNYRLEVRNFQRNRKRITTNIYLFFFIDICTWISESIDRLSSI